MTHTYKISGMTCNGCKANAESALGNLKAITKVSADLKKEEVEIEMTSHISVEELQETLLNAGLHYTIGNLDEHVEHHKPNLLKMGMVFFTAPCTAKMKKRTMPK